MISFVTYTIWCKRFSHSVCKSLGSAHQILWFAMWSRRKGQNFTKLTPDVLLFSDSKLMVKLQFISQVYYPNWHPQWFKLLVSIINTVLPRNQDSCIDIFMYTVQSQYIQLYFSMQKLPTCNFSASLHCINLNPKTQKNCNLDNFPIQPVRVSAQWTHLRLREKLAIAICIRLQEAGSYSYL